MKFILLYIRSFLPKFMGGSAITFRDVKTVKRILTETRPWEFTCSCGCKVYVNDNRKRCVIGYQDRKYECTYQTTKIIHCPLIVEVMTLIIERNKEIK